MENLTVVASRPLNGRIEIIYKIIYELGIKQHKSIHILNYDGNNNWFTENLIASLSGINKHKIAAYFHPCEAIGKQYKETPDKEFIKTITLLQNSDIIMTDFVFQRINDDYLDYFLNYSKDTETNVKDVYIINTLDVLLKKTHYDREVVLQKIKQFAQENKIEIYLITDTKEAKVEDIFNYESLKPYTKRFILSHKEQEDTLRILVKEEQSQEYIYHLYEDTNRIGEVKCK